MASAPETVDRFLDLVRKSGVVEEGILSGYLLGKWKSDRAPDTPTDLARLMVRDGLLTDFQAGQLLRGKWRRFQIGKYVILDRLGAGGMGCVFRCEHRAMRRQVAVKVLPPSRAEKPSAVHRFYREARALAALDHPNIVRAHDIDRDGDLHFLVMEYLQGATLQALVEHEGPLDVATAASFIKQAADGLEYAHRTAGIVHRDIKPSNLFLDLSRTLKILDLGLAYFLDEEENPREKVLSTPDYLAPEQLDEGYVADIRSDIYSLGATLYFLLTAQTLFPESALADKHRWHQTRQPVPVRELRPEVPAEVAAVLEQMLEKSPELRYRTPAEVGEVLAAWATEDTTRSSTEHLHV